MDDPRVVFATVFAALSIGVAALAVAFVALRSTAGTLTSRRTNQLRADMAAMAQENDRRIAALHVELVAQHQAGQWHGSDPTDGHTLAMPLTIR